MDFLPTPSTPKHRPPSDLQLLTPPPSGGFDERVTFADEVDQQIDSNYQVEIHQPLGLQSIATVKQFDAGYLSPVVRAPISQSPGTVSHLPDEPFDFTGLPIIVRRQIYGLLLAATGIICVRQKRTPGGYEPKAFISAENRQLRPGVSFALVQNTAQGLKARFCRGQYINAAILRVNKSIHHEAKRVLFGINTFELANLTRETAPPVDFRVPLFPRGYPRFVRKITMRAKSLYGFRYLLHEGGHSELKNIYRGLANLTLVLEIDYIDKGVGKKLSRKEVERYDHYVDRVLSILKLEIFCWTETSKTIPAWIQMKMLFPDDSYLEAIEEKDLKKKCLKNAVVEAFDRLKQGSRK